MPPRRESAEHHKTRILAAKSVRTYLIAHPGSSAESVLKQTGHTVALIAELGLVECRVDGGERRWYPRAGMSQPWVDTGMAALEQIERSVAAVHRKQGFEPVEESTPLSAFLRREDDDDACQGSERTVSEVRRDEWRALLAWLFEKGVDPRVAMRRLYALAHEVGPQHLRDLTHEEIALLLGDGAGRATSSARSQAIFGGLKSAMGILTQFGGSHKSAAACERMSRSAMGNRNRRGKRGGCQQIGQEAA